MDPAEKRGGSGDPDGRCTGEQPWPHRPRAARCLSRQEGRGCRARATTVPGPRPALPFSLSERRVGAGLERLGGEGHAGGRRLCARGASGAVGTTGRLPRAAGLSLCAPLRRRLRLPLPLLKPGLRSAQLLSNYPSSDLAATKALPQLAHTLLASLPDSFGKDSNLGGVHISRAPSLAGSWSPLLSRLLWQASPDQAGQRRLAASPRPSPTLCVRDPGVTRRAAVVGDNSH